MSSWLRLPLITLLGLSAVVAVGFAAIRTGSEVAIGIFTGAEMVALLLAVLLARSGPSRSRGFWFGFALFGWSAHLLAVTVSYRTLRADTDWSGNLVVRRILLGIAAYLRRPSASMVEVETDADNAVRLASSLLVVALAVVGGLVATLVRDRSDRTRTRLGVQAGRVAAIAFLLGSLAAPAVAVGFRSRPVYFLASTVERDKVRPADRSPRSWERDLFTAHLTAMGEPSFLELARRDPSAEAYRLLILPSFVPGHAIRIARDPGGGATLRVVILDGASGRRPGRIGLDRSIRISDERWADLTRHLDARGFWDPMPPTSAEPANLGVMDGTTFAIEGVRGGRHRAEVVEHSDIDDVSGLVDWVRRLSGVEFRRRPGSP